MIERSSLICFVNMPYEKLVLIRQHLSGRYNTFDAFCFDASDKLNSFTKGLA